MEDYIEFITEFTEILNIEEMNYFYHITEKNLGKVICEEGLIMAENRLSSTSVPLTKDLIKNPMELIKSERSKNIRKTEEMIIIGCDDQNVKNIIQENYMKYNSWNTDNGGDYIISNKYILGYINMDTLEFVKNENYEYYDYNYKYL